MPTDRRVVFKFLPANEPPDTGIVVIIAQSVFKDIGTLHGVASLAVGASDKDGIDVHVPFHRATVLRYVRIVKEGSRYVPSSARLSTELVCEILALANFLGDDATVANCIKIVAFRKLMRSQPNLRLPTELQEKVDDMMTRGKCVRIRIDVNGSVEHGNLIILGERMADDEREKMSVQFTQHDDTRMHDIDAHVQNECCGLCFWCDESKKHVIEIKWFRGFLDIFNEETYMPEGEALLVTVTVTYGVFGRRFYENAYDYIDNVRDFEEIAECTREAMEVFEKL